MKLYHASPKIGGLTAGLLAAWFSG